MYFSSGYYNYVMKENSDEEENSDEVENYLCENIEYTIEKN